MSDAIRTLLVDDEAPARERMRRLLAPIDDVEVIGEAEDGERAIEVILASKPDLVFLDIQMPGATGLEVAASLPSPRPRIVFCTAFEEHAVDAFELHAVDYLLKPVNRARLEKALDRVRGGAGPGTEESIGRAARAAAAYPERFLAKRGARFCVVLRRQVLYFVSEDGITRLQADERHYWMQPTIAHLEERLDPRRFLRLSRAAIVQLDAVKEVHPITGGTGEVLLRNGDRLEVSRRRFRALLDRLEGKS